MPAQDAADPPRIPRERGPADYAPEAAAARRAFATEQTGAALEHLGHHSLDAASLPGNIENFMGVAQVPIGLAGPLRVDGEHAQGDFWVPLATVEGTLVASYNRGMKLLAAVGGVRTTIVDDAMQRAPSFARGAGLRSLADRALRRDRRGGRGDDRERQAPRHRAVRGQQGALHALQLHDG